MKQCSADCMWHQQNKVCQMDRRTDDEQSNPYVAFCFTGATKTLLKLEGFGNMYITLSKLQSWDSYQMDKYIYHIKWSNTGSIRGACHLKSLNSLQTRLMVFNTSSTTTTYCLPLRKLWSFLADSPCPVELRYIFSVMPPCSPPYAKVRCRGPESCTGRQSP